MTRKLILWPPYTCECRHEHTSMSMLTHREGEHLTEVLKAEVEGDSMCMDTKKEMSVHVERTECLDEGTQRMLRHIWWQTRHKVSTIGTELILNSNVKP